MTSGIGDLVAFWFIVGALLVIIGLLCLGLVLQPECKDCKRRRETGELTRHATARVEMSGLLTPNEARAASPMLHPRTGGFLTPEELAFVRDDVRRRKIEAAIRTGNDKDIFRVTEEIRNEIR